MGLLKRRSMKPVTGNKSVLRSSVRGSLKASKGMYSSSSLSVGTPEIRDPMFTPEAFYVMNTDIKTMNKWIRYYDKYHPILPNSLDIHTLFPISDFSFKGVTDPSIKDFYDYLKNDVLFLLDWVIKISSEYERFGEAFTFFAWDSYNGYFNSAVVLNPDLLELSSIDMDGQRKFVISMDIPESFDHLMHMKDIDQRYRGLWNNLDPVIRRCVEGGLPIPLNPANVFGMQRLQSAYDPRGTSQVLRVLKDLMYEDKLREAQMAVADGHITPYQLWKLGNSASGYVPTQDEIDNFSNLLNQSDHQNLFRIVTHSDVTYDTKGVQDGLLNIIAEMDKIEDRILTALYTSRSMTTGEGPCVSADTEVLTLYGFKPFPEVTVEDMVASVNPETHEIEYCKPEKVLCFDVEGPMYLFENKALNHFVTPNHRCFVKTSPKKPFDIVLAESVKKHHCFMAAVKPFNGVNQFEITIGSKTYTMSDYLLFVGLYLSEGNLEFSKEGSCAGVCITQTEFHKNCVNPRFATISDFLLKFNSSFYFKEAKNDKGSKGRFRLYDCDLACHMQDNYSCGSGNKKIPAWVKSLSHVLLENLLKGCFLGDGSLLNKSRSTNSYEIYTISKQMSDDLQEIALKCGHASIISVRKRDVTRKDLYRVRIYLPGKVRKSVLKYPSLLGSEIKTEFYKGKVYSLDLPPNRVYVSRRKGKITVTGNTYSNAVIGLKVLEGRYQHKLYKISGIVRALYRKIAEANEIYEPLTVAQSNNGIRPSKKARKLMVPSVHWDNYFSFSKDIERAKFYLTLAEAHKVSFRRVLEILGLDFDEEQAIMQKDLKSLFETPIYEKKMKELTGDGGVGGGGVPTDLTAPPSGPMGDAGAEIPDGASAPPLPDMEDI